MVDVILFHHAHGLTPGVLAFADELRGAGHRVTVPDLYEGATFDTIEAGVGHAEEVGFDEIVARGVAAAAGLPSGTVYAGLSLGAMPAQKLAQTRPGARGALLLHSCVPLGHFGSGWPDGVPLQIHTSEADEWGDLDVARDIVDTVASAELFVYPGDRHLFSDSSLPVYDADAAALLRRRVLAFLDDLA